MAAYETPFSSPFNATLAIFVLLLLQLMAIPPSAIPLALQISFMRQRRSLYAILITGMDSQLSGLFFTQAEFYDLISTKYLSCRFHQSFLDTLFEITNGHIGAITDFIRIILEHDVGPSMMRFLI
jgi:hypothetical protein